MNTKTYQRVYLILCSDCRPSWMSSSWMWKVMNGACCDIWWTVEHCSMWSNSLWRYTRLRKAPNRSPWQSMTTSRRMRHSRFWKTLGFGSIFTMMLTIAVGAFIHSFTSMLEGNCAVLNYFLSIKSFCKEEKRRMLLKKWLYLLFFSTNQADELPFSL